jgi:two-component system, chemotaxis family, sensor kinase CheA
MIEDKELNSLFQAESEDRLNHLEEGLKQLESDPTNKAIIEEIFRDAHTVKGAARMLSIHPIEKLAHALEDGLGACRQGILVFSPPIFSLYYKAIDALRLLSNEAVTGVAANVSTGDLLNQLNLKNLEPLQKFSNRAEQKAVSKEPPIATSLEPTPAFELKSTPLETPLEPLEDQKTSLKETVEEKNTVFDNSQSEEQKIVERVSKQSLKSSIIRISMLQLSELTAQAGDLTVIKNRIIRIFDFIEKLANFWEYQMRELAQYRYSLSETNDSKTPATSNDALAELFNETEKNIYELKSEAYGNFHKLDAVVLRLTDEITQLGLVPLSKLFNLFPRMVQELALVCSKDVEFQIEGDEILVDRKIIEDLKDPLMHLLRNSLDHGIELPHLRESQNKPKIGTIRLTAKQTSNTIIIEVIDDGSGLNIEKIRQNALKKGFFTQENLNEMSSKQIESLIFLPGLSTKGLVSELSGRGVGLDVVKVGIEKLNGTIQLESIEGKGCRFIIELPTILVTTHVVLIQVRDRVFSLPIEAIEYNAYISMDQIFLLEGSHTVILHDQPISIVIFEDLLGWSKKNSEKEKQDLNENSKPCMILKVGQKRAAFIVDAILEEQKVIITPPNEFSGGLPFFSGVTILKTGDICVALNPTALLDTIQKNMNYSNSISSLKNIAKSKRKKVILVVDDAQLARVVIKRSLEDENYEIITAENGIQALSTLKTTSIDALVTDAEMPEMDGFELITQVRANNQYSLLPIIMVTTLSSALDKKRALDVGANAYINKASFNQQILITSLKDFFHE